MTMAVAGTNVVVGSDGTVSWGTTGITLPATGTAAITGFNDLGYLDEDGVTFSSEPSIQEFAVWQSRQPVRREALEQKLSLSGKFAEWNTNSVPRAFGGGTLTALNAGSYNFPSSTAALEEFAVVADVVDGSQRHLRFVFARVNQTEAVEVQFNRSNLAVVPFNFGILAPSGGGSPGAVYT